MSIPLKPPPPDPPVAPPPAEPEAMLGREEAKVVAWRVMFLEKAGWSPEAALQIANIHVADLVEMGYSVEEANHEYHQFWRVALQAIECGDEARALYLIGLSSER